MTKPAEKPSGHKKAEDLVAQVESGGRKPKGTISRSVLFFVPLFWTLFQLWYASPLPFIFNVFVLNDTEARSIHLAFAVFLAYTAFPTFKSSPKRYIPVQDWIVAFIAAFCAGYIFLFYNELANRPGKPISLDLIVAIAGLIFLLEATRRALGPPLMVVAAVFITYTFAGPYMPDVIAHQGASLVKGMSHYWLSTEGVYGVALGVSTGMVFMFVLFGSLLEAAGAGNYFIRTAFAGLGHMRGGPAKAAVVSSAMTGLVSGSSIANVVTTGTFTIPLMKKVGFSAEKAGAVVRFACKVPELELSTDITVLPALGPTAQAGYYFLLPVVVLMWCLTVERLSPSLSAFWATMLLLFVVVTQHPLKGFFRRAKGPEYSVKRGLTEMISGMVSGGRNMIGIGVATAAAGIVVGTVTLTGIGLVMTEFVEFISGGNLMLILLFTAVISLLLGMGLPTTANYIVVATLMAPVIVSLGAQSGLIVPLIAVHLFVFYFGILADDTPPVGLAAFAAAGISGGDPIRTGIQGFMYDIRTAILPFIFIFNNELLMIGIGSWLHLIIVVFGAVVAMLAFAAATQGWFMTKSRWWETIAPLLIAFILFRPGYFWDRLYPPLIEVPAIQLVEVLDTFPDGERLRLTLKGEKDDGSEYFKTVMLKVGNEPTGAEKLRGLGITTRDEDGKVIVDMVGFSSAAEKARIDFDQEIVNIQLVADRPNKEWMFIPALLLLALVWILQRRRSRKNLITGGRLTLVPGEES